MSEKSFFQTETRPRREVRASRETENKTRREIKQLNKFQFARDFYCRLSLSVSLSVLLPVCLTVCLSLSFLSVCLSFFTVTTCGIKNLWFEGIYLDLSLTLLLVLLLTRFYYFSFLTRSYISHEKRERDEISLMVSFLR